MKAITLWQPWATLVAIGVKRLETRSWPIPRAALGQAVAIHAAKRAPEWTTNHAINNALARHGFENEHQDAPPRVLLPRGRIVAVGELQHSYRIDEAFLASPYFREEDRPFGDFTPGRFAWDLGKVVPLRAPIPSKGAQGLWTWEPPAPLWDLEAEAFERSIHRCDGCGRIVGGPIVFEVDWHPMWGCRCAPDCECGCREEEE